MSYNEQLVKDKHNKQRAEKIVKLGKKMETHEMEEMKGKTHHHGMAKHHKSMAKHHEHIAKHHEGMAGHHEKMKTHKHAEHKMAHHRKK